MTIRIEIDGQGRITNARTGRFLGSTDRIYRIKISNETVFVVVPMSESKIKQIAKKVKWSQG